MPQSRTLYLLILMLGLSISLFAREIKINFDSEIQSSEVLLVQYSYDSGHLSELNSKANSDIDKILLTLHVRATKGASTTEKRYKIQLREGTHKMYWYPSQIGTIVSAVFTINDTSASIASQAVQIGYKILPVARSMPLVQGYSMPTASLIDILAWRERQNTSPDFRVFRWQVYPDVLIFSFESRKIQAKYLKRLAFFTEKTITRGTVQNLQDIAHRKGWGAHDYKSEDLAVFFTQAETLKFGATPIVLTQEEILLRKLLIDAGVISRIENSDSKKKIVRYIINLQTPNAAIATYARSDSSSLQRTLLFHELLHTIYFRDKDLQNKVDTIWQSLSMEHQQLWQKFLYYNGYDASYKYLVKNELYAYLLQRPVADLSWYVPSRIIPETNTKLNSRESKIFTDTLIHNAKTLATYMNEYYQVSDGNVEYITQY